LSNRVRGWLILAPFPPEVTMAENGNKRISIEVSPEIHNYLERALPWGTKAEVMRSLIEIFIKAQKKAPNYIAQDVMNGRYELTLVQNLNKNGDV
jgi:hypothetical protein